MLLSQAIKMNNLINKIVSCKEISFLELLVVLLYMSILILLGSDLENVQNLVIIHAIWPDRYKTTLAETVFILK